MAMRLEYKKGVALASDVDNNGRYQLFLTSGLMGLFYPAQSRISCCYFPQTPEGPLFYSYPKLMHNSPADFAARWTAAFEFLKKPSSQIVTSSSQREVLLAQTLLVLLEPQREEFASRSDTMQSHDLTIGLDDKIRKEVLLHLF